MAIIDRIKYDGNGNGGQWLVYKYPSESFVLGSQLIVNQGQEALFFKGGKALDLFKAGTHTLTTGNLPLLHKIIDLPFGGKTPFTAEIYYINKTSNLDLKWGTSTPIPLEDPKYGLILNVGARGQYGITIYDSRLFVSRIIGAVPNGFTANPLIILRYFNGLINEKIKSVTSKYMIENQISFLEISQYLAELSIEFKKALDEEFERFGMELVTFHCESIAPNPQEKKKLREYKEELALGKDFYQQRRSLDILEKIAENSGTDNMTNVGIRLGLGLGAKDQIDNVLSQFGQKSSDNKKKEQIICPKCGAHNNTQMKYCGNCGNKLITSIICPHCGKEVPDEMKYCGNCGKPLFPSTCPSCGFENKAGMKYCGNCGEKL